MNYTVIDFETANAQRNSACAIGIAYVENNIITQRIYRLIRPQNMFFHPRNIDIHGITALDVENEPEFDELYTEIKDLLENDLVVAHNAPFDMGVLKAVLQSYDIAIPRIEYIDSVVLARKLWPNLPNHKLNTLAEANGFKFTHHNALEDAEVTAKILIKATIENDVFSLKELIEFTKMSIKILK
ncbi:MAG: 3'-5' exonuclease [Bacteroidales bacterium]|nr:3'-5' exonuclease [Bacteroidales bacterium]